MKHFLRLTAAAFLAVPLLAETAATTDSPLVAAAKRANRAGKKPARVITNETLVRDGGHITTASSQDPINVASSPVPAPMQSSTQTVLDPRVSEHATRLLERQKTADELRAREAARAAEKARYLEQAPPTAASQQEGGLPPQVGCEPRRSANTSRPRESKSQN